MLPSRRGLRVSAVAGALSVASLGGLFAAPTASAAAGVTVLYKNNDTAPSDNQIKPGLELVNNGSSALDLSTVTVRYYFTHDSGASAYTYNCDYAAIGCGNVHASFVGMASPTATADTYVQLSFTGSLAAGANSGDIQSRVNKTDWSNFDETNDYSHGTNTAYASTSTITVYVNGTLVSGTEPGGGGGGSGDTTAPSAPTNLQVMGTTSTSVSLSWTASTDDTGVTGYEVFRGSTQVGTPTATSFTDTGLTPSAQYDYTVKALDAAGNVSAASSVVTATTSAGTVNTNVNIDGSTTYQTIDGFGASEAFGQASNVMNAPASVQKQVFDYLYSPTAGAGFTILRNLIPSDSSHTIEPTAPSGSTATPTYRALGDDWGQEWFTEQAIANGVTTIYADAWSAPAFMKTNNDESNGGALCGVPNATCVSGDWRQAYANYLVQYLNDYKANGIDIDYVGFENEPNLQTSYSSMVLSPSQSADFADVLGPTLADSGLSTELACCDAEGWQQAPSYTSAITNDPAASQHVALFTSHGYTGAPTTPLATGGKPAWETEWSTFESFDPAWDDNSAASGLSWAQNIYTALTAANLNAVLFWWGTTTPSYNGDNEGLLNINGSTLQVTGRLWAFAGFSRFVRPGSVRLGTTTANQNLDVVSFRNPAGQTILVVINKASSAQSIGVGLNGIANASSAVGYETDSTHTMSKGTTLAVTNDAFSASVPARSMVTYVVSGGGSGSDTTPPSAPANLTATATTTNSVSLSWTASTDDTGVVGYQVYRGTTLVGSPTSTSFTDTGLTASTQYSYTVKAVDAAGNVSAASASVNATTKASSDTTPPSVPTNVTVTGTTSDSVSLSWTASTDDTGVTGYQVIRQEGDALQVVGTPTTTSFTDTGLTASMQYSYVVKALDAAGNLSAASAAVTATTSSSGGSGGGCSATLHDDNDWGSGFTGTITVTNTGTSTTKGWNVTWTWGGNQTVTNYWNAAVTTAGSSVTATNLGYNGAIAPGGNNTFGLQVSYSGSDAAPTLACTAS